MSLCLIFQTYSLSPSFWDLSSSLRKAPLRSPTAHVELLQPSFTHKTFPSQQKTMSGCIPIPDTIISISKLRREEMTSISFSADVSFSSSETEKKAWLDETQLSDEE